MRFHGPRSGRYRPEGFAWGLPQKNRQIGSTRIERGVGERSNRPRAGLLPWDAWVRTGGPSCRRHTDFSRGGLRFACHGKRWRALGGDSVLDPNDAAVRIDPIGRQVVRLAGVDLYNAPKMTAASLVDGHEYLGTGDRNGFENGFEMG